MINMGKESKKKKKGTALLVEMQIDTATLENSMEIPLKKTRNKPTMRPGNPIAGHKAWEKHNWKGRMYPSVCRSTIHNDSDTEAT